MDVFLLQTCLPLKNHWMIEQTHNIKWYGENFIQPAGFFLKELLFDDYILHVMNVQLQLTTV